MAHAGSTRSQSAGGPQISPSTYEDSAREGTPRSCIICTCNSVYTSKVVHSLTCISVCIQTLLHRSRKNCCSRSTNLLWTTDKITHNFRTYYHNKKLSVESGGFCEHVTVAATIAVIDVPFTCYCFFVKMMVIVLAPLRKHWPSKDAHNFANTCLASIQPRPTRMCLLLL